MRTGYTPLTQLTLRPAMFDDAERPLLETADHEVTAFRYASGVEALRIVSDRVELIVLPFRGQQVWRYAVDGEDLTMSTHFEEPARSTAFPETYGAFLLHCGLTGIGHPGPDDTHAHHGELPNAAYDEAYLVTGDAPEGPWVGLSGTHRIRMSHGVDVLFSPFLALRPGGTALDLDVTIENLRRSAFGYSYLCHINWPIFDGARLLQTVPMDSEHVEIAPDPAEDEQTARYTSAIADDLASSNELSLDQSLIPEYCAILDPVADEDGVAHFMMLREDGWAAAVSFETEHLPRAVRWISNTGDETAAGFCLPATAHHRGRVAAEADGMVREVPGDGEISMAMTVEMLEPERAKERADLIGRINGS